MATVIRSPLGNILAAIKTQLLTDLQWEDHRILYTRGGQSPPFRGDQDILLRPKSLTPDEGWVRGSGRMGSEVVRPLEVISRTRLALDMSDRTDSWLTDEDLGQLTLEELILDSLQLFFPVDSQGNALTVEPIRLIPSGEGVDMPPDPSWGQTALLFSLRYTLPLRQDRQ